MTEVPDGIQLEEVDSLEGNYFDPARNTIVLDKRLNLYPELKDFVLKHELQHALIEKNSDNRIEAVIKNLHLDVVHDFKRLTGKLELSEQDEKYQSLEKKMPELKYAHYTFMNGLRALIFTFMHIALIPYLFAKEMKRNYG